MKYRNLALIALLSLTLAAPAEAEGPDPTIDPFVRIAANGEAVFGVLFGETERVARGLYRVDFARDLSRCATSLTLRYTHRGSRAPLLGSTLSVPDDAQAVYVVVSSKGHRRDSGFDLLLRCAPVFVSERRGDR